ncbi:AraC family transcriptional regulator [Opitutaceae bacterium TAV4]|nr:AraC family transcriptional regulator [Opitutaceae bacterium TAV4]RRJ98743.1 AraC family transcriptional regulator [Opitutaceae bacterium TAV3]
MSVPDSIHRRLECDLRNVLLRLRSEKLRVRIPCAAGLHRPQPNAHFHPTPELFIQTGGATDFVCPLDEFRLETNEVCVMLAGVPHAETPVNRRTAYDVLVCMHARDGLLLHRGRMEGGTMTGAAGSGHCIRGYETTDLRNQRSCAAFHHLDEIAAADGIEGGERRRYVAALLEAFLLTVLSELKRHAAHASPPVPEALSLVMEAEKLARTRFGDPGLTVARLAKDLGCSAAHLSRRFHGERGVTLAAWIVAERIALARTHLTNPRYNIAEIAWMCGFTSPAYFIHVFRKHTSITPRAYRVGLQTNWAVDAPKRKRAVRG